MQNNTAVLKGIKPGNPPLECQVRMPLEKALPLYPFSGAKGDARVFNDYQVRHYWGLAETERRNKASGMKTYAPIQGPGANLPFDGKALLHTMTAFLKVADAMDS